MADKKPDANPATAPDPEEDDLDELDEMLDEFSNTKIDSSKQPAAQPSASSKDVSKDAPTADDDPSVDDFAKHIQESMASMIKELEQDPESMKQFEQLMKGFADPAEFNTGEESSSSAAAAAAPAPTPTPSANQKETAAKSQAAKPSAADANFQDTIKRTMERMKASNESADAANANPAEDDMMAQLLKELASAGGGEDGDDSFSKMLLGMMEQLTNKDILYEPMKELDGKFDGWLATNQGKLDKEDEKRYKDQRGLVREIVARFEKEGYADTNASDREYIVERMQKMQAAGAPPPDLVGDMGGAEQMLGGAEQGCAQQ